MENERVMGKIKTNILDAYLFLDIIKAKHNLLEDKNIEELENILQRIEQYVEEI